MTKPATIDPKLVDQLLETYQQPEDLLGENGLLKQLTKRCSSVPSKLR